MRFVFLLVGFLWLLLLTACGGFEPLYAKKYDSVDDILNRVSFESTSERSGQILYTALYQMLKVKSTDTGTDYILKVSELNIQRSGIGIAADGTTRLDQIIITADFTLSDKDYAPLRSFRLRSVSTYNVAEADAYSTETAFQTSRDRMLYDIAKQARLQLLSILKQEAS